VEEVVVRFEDVNGPRGGIDKECRLQVRLAPWGALEVEERRADLYAAIDVAAQRLGRAVARELERRRDARDAVRPLG
jgi:ribosome-associated translation inhibitor RaiA